MLRKIRTGEDKMAYKYYTESGKLRWRAEKTRSNFDRGTTKTFNTKKEAEAWERLDEVPKKEINFKFGRLAELFLDNTKPILMRNHDNWHTHESRLRNHILPVIKNRFASSLTTSDITKIHDRSRQIRFDTKDPKLGISIKTLKGINTSVNQVLDYAVQRGFLSENTVKGKMNALLPQTTNADFNNKKIKGIKPGSPVFAPSDKEVQKYLEFFHKNETHYHFFYMLATTGCRMSEMRTLKWDSVDFTRKTLSVMDSKSEAGIRTITINDTQIELLQKQKQNLQLGFLERNKMLSDQDFVFCNLKTINNPKYDGMYAENTFTSLWTKKRNQLFLQQQINQVSDDEKVRRFNCHDLRHYHASVLIKSGKNILQISQRLGHGSVEVTLNVYGHLFADDQDNSSDIATEKLPLLD